MLNTAIILAGGFGTRLRSVVGEVPKPMAPVAGKPFVEHLLLWLKHYGISKVVFSTGHLAEKIRSHFGEDFHGTEIKYSHENSPLGTGGAVALALQQCADENVVVLNGDSFFDIDLRSFIEHYLEDRPDASVALRKVPDASRYGKIATDDKHRIISFKEKSDHKEEGLINGGIYILRSEVFLENIPPYPAFSIEKDYFEKHLSKLNFTGYAYRSFFIDIGMPEDYSKAQHEFKGFKY